MLRSGIAESYDNSIFRFLRTLPTVLYGGCTNLHPHLFQIRFRAMLDPQTYLSLSWLLSTLAPSYHDCFSSLAFSAHSLPQLMCLKKKETKGVCVCSWVWSLTCFGGEYSKYQVMYSFIGEKKSKPSCGAWNCLVPTRSLFFYPVRIGNLNTLSIISWRRCYGSLHSSMSARSLVYLTGSELHMGTLVPADLPNQLREGFPPLPSSLQVPKGPSHGGGCGNCIIRLQIQSSWES